MLKASVSQSLAHAHFNNDGLLAKNHIGSSLHQRRQSVQGRESADPLQGAVGDKMVDGVPAEIGEDRVKQRRFKAWRILFN
jgi:hypothetical protein